MLGAFTEVFKAASTPESRSAATKKAWLSRQRKAKTTEAPKFKPRPVPPRRYFSDSDTVDDMVEVIRHNRMVDALKKFNEVMSNPEESVEVWHGSVKGAVTSILTHGLLTSKTGTGVDAVLGQSPAKTAVYVSVTEEFARSQAAQLAEAKGASAVLFKVRVPKEVFAKQFKEDPQSLKQGGFTFAKNIPPEWIEGYNVYKPGGLDVDEMTGNIVGKAAWVKTKKAAGDFVFYATVLVKEPVLKADFSRVFKRNPYHDNKGRFTSKDKAGHADHAFDAEPHDAQGNVNLAAHYRKHDDPKVTDKQILKQFTPRERALVRVATNRSKTAPLSFVTYAGAGTDVTTLYSAERQKLHQKIIEEILNPAAVKAATPAKGQSPRMVVLGGRGGSGKSAFTHMVNRDGSITPSRLKEFDSRKFIVLDSDAIKERLKPPYAGWNAYSVHDESSHVYDMLEEAVRANRLNVVHDVTLRSLKDIERVIKASKERGYSIEGHYMFVPRQVSAVRAVQRFLGKEGKGDGRLVPPEVVLSNKDNEANFDKLKTQYFDRWSAYDNQGTEPKLLGRGTRKGA